MISIFMFFDVATGKQMRYAFSKEFKHVSVITFDGEVCLSHDFGKHGIYHRKVKCNEISKLLERLKSIKSLTRLVCVNRKMQANFKWFPLWIRSCNEIAVQITGVEVGFTFNPWHLYKKLLNFNNKTNYEVLYAWRRKNNGCIRR